MSIKEGIERASDNLLRPRFIAEKVWCPLCNDYSHLIKSANAAKLASVHRRTIYRYIEEGAVYALKIAGKSIRVCSGCLLKHSP